MVNLRFKHIFGGEISQKLLFILFLNLITFYLVNAAFADSIVLKSGKIVEGKITEETSEYVKMDYEGISLTYWRSDIERVEKSASDSANIEVIPVEQPAKEEVKITIKQSAGNRTKDFIEKLDDFGRDIDKIIMEAQRKIISMEVKTLGAEHRAIMSKAVEDVNGKMEQIRKLEAPPDCTQLKRIALESIEAGVEQFSDETTKISSLKELEAYWTNYAKKIAELKDKYRKERDKLTGTITSNQSDAFRKDTDGNISPIAITGHRSD